MLLSAELKEPTERSEKKASIIVASSSSSSSVASNTNNSVKHSSSSSANNVSEKEQRKETKDRDRDRSEREKERESTEKVIAVKEKTKESKRDKEDGEIRKRDRGEKRRERERNKIATPPSYYNDRYDDRAVSPSFYEAHGHSPSYVEPNDRFHGDVYDERERDRDLSSISNSSKGSTNRRSQDSPDTTERELKRRRVDNSKVNHLFECCKWTDVV